MASELLTMLNSYAAEGGRSPSRTIDRAHSGYEALEIVREARAGHHPYTLTIVGPVPDQSPSVVVERLHALDAQLHLIAITTDDSDFDTLTSSDLRLSHRIVVLRATAHAVELHQTLRVLSHKWSLAGRVEHLADERNRAVAQARRHTDQLSQERAAHQERIAFLTNHDPLTGLPSRAYIVEKIAHEMQRQRRRAAHRFAVVVIGLDRFNPINESFGHSVGDRLLVDIATHVYGLVRHTDTLSRLEGDQFAILVRGTEDERDPVSLTDRIHRMMKEPFSVQNVEVYVSVSAGIAFGRPEHTTPEQLLRDACIAMNRAKRNGKGRTETLKQEAQVSALRRLKTETELAGAVARDQFLLHYQPIISLRRQRFVGLEALIRWQHPERNLLFPGDFIDLAEESQQIVAIGEWVLKRALLEMAHLNRQMPGMIEFVSVNLSARQLERKGLVGIVRSALSASGLEPHHIKVEVTETMMMSSLPTIFHNLRKLKSMGVSICLDDFGTGYSSLSVLHRMPVDVIKIDREFINELETSDKSLALVEVIAKIAHTLDMEIVAEGIETEEQAEILTRLGCQLGQGFYFSRPVPMSDIIRRLQTQSNPGNTLEPRAQAG